MGVPDDFTTYFLHLGSAKNQTWDKDVPSHTAHNLIKLYESSKKTRD